MEWSSGTMSHEIAILEERDGTEIVAAGAAPAGCLSG